jgi:hypothetical protein
MQVEVYRHQIYSKTEFPLADLPDVFGKENQNIILEHLPDMEYYNPNAMKPEDRFSDGNSVLL